jgi:Zn ribbon nucleic-acid-binding protein
MAAARAHGRPLENRPLQCPNCSERMTLQNMKREASVTVFECKPCKLSISETIKDDPNDRTLQ